MWHLPGIIKTENVWVLQSLENRHLLLETDLFTLVVLVLLRGEGESVVAIVT